MTGRVYIYCRDNPDAYQDDVVVLAEGLQALGVEVFGNCNYWRRSPAPDDWLLRFDPRVKPADCDIVVVSYCWVRWLDREFRIHASPLPEGLFAHGRRYRTAYVDLDDGYLTPSWRPEFRAFDVVFRAKYNRACFHPSNHRPWALGYTSRVVQSIGRVPPWEERHRSLLVNFNASHPYIHPARALMEAKFTPVAARHFEIDRTRDDLSVAPSDPTERLRWDQTQRRHSQSYYDRLGRAQAAAAFCGELIPPRPFQPSYLVGGRKARLRRAVYEVLAHFDSAPPRLIQWDSWRFWEALVAGCAVFNFELPHFGVELPVMPENFVHYIGVRPDNVTAVFQRLDADPALLGRIASRGRAWTMEHYSPGAVAKRFLTSLA
ncbi:MAG TPA: hypothetical protein VHE61_13565 [Opitutaceae bacterium]|nr:hypothetical protein [Opitutaceae bacterium]